MQKALNVMFIFLVPSQTHSQASDLVTQGTSALKSVPTVKRNLNLGTVSFLILFVRAIIVLDLIILCKLWPLPFTHFLSLSLGIGKLVCDLHAIFLSYYYDFNTVVSRQTGFEMCAEGIESYHWWIGVGFCSHFVYRWIQMARGYVPLPRAHGEHQEQDPVPCHSFSRWSS